MKRGKWKESGEKVREREGEGKKNKFRIRNGIRFFKRGKDLLTFGKYLI